MDVAAELENRLVECVDAMVVNMPYVPTSEAAATLPLLGPEGEQPKCIDRILSVADNHLSDKKWFYLVTVGAKQPYGIMC